MGIPIPRCRPHYRWSIRLSSLISISAEVKEALRLGIPVVALESTIISHGMPYPKNLEVAKLIEKTVRDSGAIPATVAIIEGIPKVGLDEKDLLILASGTNVLKASTRDIPLACALKSSAATTVASTMRLSSLAGIKFFATGGVGGVHRFGSEVTFDISADLIELSRTPVAVFCAGIKSILDIPKTLEVLETNNVPVVSYRCTDFPSFYTNNSGIKSPAVIYKTLDIAKMMKISTELGLPNGILIGIENPEPANADRINYAINFALNSANDQGIKGAAITPFLLSKIEKLTQGTSLESNIALVLNNAKIAACISRRR